MKRTSVVASVLIACLALVACSEDQPILGSKPQIRGLSVPFTKVDYIYAGNSLNPFDSIGVRHNYMLQYAHAYCEFYGWPDSSASYDVNADIVLEYLDEWLRIITETDTLDFSEARPADTLAHWTRDLFNNQFPNDSTWTLWDDLNEDVQDFLMDMAGIFDDTTVTDVYAEIEELETPFINITDSSFARTRFHILATASIARHSYAYWIDTTRRPYWPFEEYPDGSKIYLTRGRDGEDQGSKSDKQGIGSDIATSDAVGGVAGAVGGAITGTVGTVLLSVVTGNPLTLWLVGAGGSIGFITGEIGGMVTASMQDAAMGGAMGRSIKNFLGGKKEEKEGKKKK